jgi:hypothetical protein
MGGLIHTCFFTDDNEGYLKVQDHSMLHQIIADLVNAPAAMVGEDVEVTELLEPLNIDIGYW